MRQSWWDPARPSCSEMLKVMKPPPLGELGGFNSPGSTTYKRWTFLKLCGCWQIAPPL